MAKKNKGESAQNQQQRGGSSGGRGPQSQAGAGEAQTGTRDEHYNLISVLYHALQGAETYSQYIRDAEKASDTELVEFLRECREEEMMRAQRAKMLLSERLEAFGDELDEGDEEVSTEDEEASEGAPI